MISRFPKGGEEIDTDIVRRQKFEKLHIKVANEKFGRREDAKELLTRMMQACIAAFAPDPLEFMIEFLTKEIGPTIQQAVTTSVPSMAPHIDDNAMAHLEARWLPRFNDMEQKLAQSPRPSTLSPEPQTSGPRTPGPEL